MGKDQKMVRVKTAQTNVIPKITPSQDLLIRRYRVEEEQKWKDEITNIPWLHFRGDWQVRVIPPFGDAVVRFQVMLPSGLMKSVYLDARNSLGIWGSVSKEATRYWEVYPYRGDVGRCDADDVTMLMEMIQDERGEKLEGEEDE